MLGPNMISHLLGISLVVVAFLIFGRGIVNRSKGKPFQPLWAFIMILVAIGYQFVYPEVRIWDRLAHLLTDFGIGMGIAAIYLAANRQSAKLFWVPGILAALLGGALNLVSFVYQKWVCTDLKHDTRTIELLVELGPDDQISEIAPILNKYGAEFEKAFPEVDLSEDEDLAQYYLVYVDSTNKEPLMIELRNDHENVDQLDRNHPVNLIQPDLSEITRKNPVDYIANDPYLKQQWFAEKLDYNKVHEILKNTSPKKKAKVAIVDTGVDSDHEDISGVYTASGGDGDQDFHSHGTHCGGLAGAATNNGKGVGSMNWDGEYITLSGYPALDAQGRGTDQKVAKAIIAAADGDADVISMSLGGFAPFGAPKAQKDAIKYAMNKGAIVVVAAGNSNDDARKYSPANIKGVITVAAIDENFNKAVFSNINTRLTRPIAAPGVNILSSVPGSQYQSYNGTSMATPIVSGLVGIMKAFNPDITAAEAYKILEETGTTVSDSEKVGKVIDPVKAIQAVN